ncbi:cyclin-dependent kinase regulatory subunit-domain-containing protein [Cladochytrium replicatum]|nr:cyclin-dependent kinase regulatory subunit-domain-containing protein [Cladochytrium replicatum]
MEDDKNRRRQGRNLAPQEQREHDIAEYENQITYSPRYNDDVYEFRHVCLPKQIARWVTPDRLMTETEWRSLGVKQSHGWVHYMIHKPEPHILLFRREKDYQVKYPNGTGPTNGGVGGLVG